MTSSGRSPVVSVLMAVHNGSQYIKEAVQSLLDQTFSDWELVLVLDGCTDGTEAQLLSVRDDRIQVVALTERVGLAAALNVGLRHCRAEYVARLDADDRCLPRRLELQVRELDRRPHLAVLGSHAYIIDRLGAPVGLRAMPTGSPCVADALLWRDVVIHPSVMFRRSVVLEVGGYDDRLVRMEDYCLWLAVVREWAIDNLPLPLIELRTHAGQHSRGRTSVSDLRLIGIAKIDAGATLGLSTRQVWARHIVWLTAQAKREAIRRARSVIGVRRDSVEQTQ